jgi:TrmH family RNA methyltransferase
MQLTDLKLSENPLILIAEAQEKTGNVGALFSHSRRSKPDAVIVANRKVTYSTTLTMK